MAHPRQTQRMQWRCIGLAASSLAAGARHRECTPAAETCGGEGTGGGCIRWFIRSTYTGAVADARAKPSTAATSNAQRYLQLPRRLVCCGCTAVRWQCRAAAASRAARGGGTPDLAAATGVGGTVFRAILCGDRSPGKRRCMRRCSSCDCLLPPAVLGPV